MTGNLTLYPEILTPTGTIRGRWTFLWIGLSMAGIWWIMRAPLLDKGGAGGGFATIPELSISLDVYRGRIQQLQQTIGQTDTQSRYREYQQILRDVVGRVYGVDISSTTLQSLKYAHTGLQTSFVQLLERSYYYPYNLETGDTQIMQQEIQDVLALIPDESITKSTKE